MFITGSAGKPWYSCRKAETDVKKKVPPHNPQDSRDILITTQCLIPQEIPRRSHGRAPVAHSSSIFVSFTGLIFVTFLIVIFISLKDFEPLPYDTVLLR